ncbi:MAG: TlpA family protein disulfide reductase [Solirubrobacteraceae bacterium]
MSRRSRSRLLLALALVVAVVIAGVVRGGSAPSSAAPSKAAVAAAFAGSPPPLAALHAGGGELRSGGVKAFQAQLRALRGHPVVVAEWGSWCPPCRAEFPVYQRVSVADGRTVAFLGLDVRDRPPGGAQLLRSFPVTFPSWLDPAGAIAAWLRSVAASPSTAGGYPQTVLIDRRGVEVHDRSGPYESAAALQRDIVRYLLG